MFFRNRCVCCHILCQICDRVAFGLKFTGVERDAASGLRPERQRMVDIVFVKAGCNNLFRSQITRELVDNGADDFQMRKLFSTYIGIEMLRPGIMPAFINLMERRWVQ